VLRPHHPHKLSRTECHECEVRRRERVIRIFPNRESTIRLLGALLMEQDEQWSTGKRYLDLSAYWQWREAGHDAQEDGPAVTP
jgi:transposase-like protein